MEAASGIELRALKDHPFDLLRELERRSKAAMAGAVGDDINVEEWVGVGFRIDDDRFIVARPEIREVLMVPSSVTRVPGSRTWIRGLANIRGHLLPIIDLKAFLGAGVGGGQRSARVLVTNTRDVPVGLIVDEVFGFRRFLASEHTDQSSETMLRCERYLDGTYARGSEEWPVFSMQRLLTSEDFQRAEEGPRTQI
jgi:twitching motility protein PilI